MRCVSALSTARNTNAAFHQVLATLDERSGGETADLCLIFASMHHADELGKISKAFLEQNQARHTLGCTGESIVGDDREVENGPALAILAITLDKGVALQPLRLDEPGDPFAWMSSVEHPRDAVLLMLGDPFSFRIHDFLKRINVDAAGLRVVGGMASGSQVPRANQLVLDGEAYSDGAVAVLLTGPLAIRTIVSQGCRPVGHTMIVTRAEQNVIHELGRKPALEALRAMFQDLPPDDQRRLQNGLHIGRVINEYQDSFQRGDFLVHNVSGASNSGAIQITDLIRVGQTVQFHVRDAESADEDLRIHLRQAHEQAGESDRPTPAGALLFTCNGRGSRLFDAPNHDAAAIREVFGEIPVAGFFAMGEIGPIGGQNFVHGYTASMILFENR